MNKIGILQGRLLPADIKKYQLFPVKTWEKEFEVCQTCGFSALELLLDIGDYSRNPLLNEQEREKIVKLSKEFSISIPSVCADFFKHYGFFQNSPQVKEGNLAILKRLIESCNTIQCQNILIPFLEETEIRGVEDKEAVARMLDVVSGLLEKYRINLCFEMSLSGEETLKLMEEINHPNIKIYYDLGNSAYFKFNPSEEICQLGQWLGGVHVKDRNEKGDNVILGTGLVNFTACFASLKKINYQGSYILETTMANDSLETAKKHLEFVKKFIT